MTTDDAQLAADIARQAGTLLLEIRAQGADDVGRAGDLRSNEFLLAKLAELRPTDAVLSEEAADDHTRLKANRVWIIDPLDGTREFAMPDRPDWAVHVALYEAGQGITAAAVAMPALNEVWSTADPRPSPSPSHGGSTAEKTVPRPSRSPHPSRSGGAADKTMPHPTRTADAAEKTVAAGAGQPPVAEGHAHAAAENRRVGVAAHHRGKVVVVSDSRPPVFAQAVADAIGARLQPMGSAGAKTMAVVRGDADAYVHAGGQWEWDSAAPVGVALAAGLHASRADGSPLRYNQPHPYLPDLVICRPDLADAVLAAIATA